MNTDLERKIEKLCDIAIESEERRTVRGHYWTASFHILIYALCVLGVSQIVDIITALKNQ